MGNEVQMTSGVVINTNMSAAQNELNGVENLGFVNQIKTHNVVQSVNGEKDVAESILSSAKNDGFEETLKAIAEGMFDNEKNLGGEEITTELPENNINNDDTIKEGTESVDDESMLLDSEANINKEEQEEQEFESLSVPEKIEVLKIQTTELSDRLDDAVKRVGVLELDDLTRDELIEILLIQLAINKEQDEEEKLSLFEILVAAMTRLLVGLVEEDNQQGQEIMPLVNHGKHLKRKEPISFEEARKIHQNGTKSRLENVEKPAA